MSQILVIEDDPFVRKFYERLFKLNNYEVEMARDGPEGLKKAKLLKPKLILLDVMMPGMNGLEVLEQLKLDPATEKCEVVMLTNLQEISGAKKAAELGATAWLVKSDISDKQLLDIVKRHT